MSSISLEHNPPHFIVNFVQSPLNSQKCIAKMHTFQPSHMYIIQFLLSIHFKRLAESSNRKIPARFVLQPPLVDYKQGILHGR